MSAFLVSLSHIDALVTFARKHRVTFYLPVAGHGERATRLSANDPDSLNAIGNILLRENERSLQARYGDETRSAPYVFETGRELSPIECLKACACFDYQACETEDYGTTHAAEIIRTIRHAAINALPGYGDAIGWDVPDQRKPKPAALEQRITAAKEAIERVANGLKRGPIATNELRKGARIKLRNGWYATIADNARGNIRMATVEGFETETGSVYAHDIAAAHVNGEWLPIAYTKPQLKLRAQVSALGM